MLIEVAASWKTAAAYSVHLSTVWTIPVMSLYSITENWALLEKDVVVAWKLLASELASEPAHPTVVYRFRTAWAQSIISPVTPTGLGR